MIAIADASVWKEAFLGISLQHYLESFAVIVVATALNLVLKLYLNKKAEKWSTQKSLVSSMLRLLIKPLRFLIIIVALVFVKRIIDFPPPLDKTLSNVLLVMFGLNIAFFLTRLVDLYVDGFLAPKVEKTESKLDDTLLLVVRKSVKWFIWIISIAVVLENIDVNIASLVAGLGIGGLAVALAAQETLKNFFGSIAIFSDRPFHVGERVQIEGTDGAVEAVGFRSTKIRTLDGTLVAVPNAKVADSVIDNIAKRRTIKNLYNIGVTYNTSSEKLEKALEILRDVIGRHPSTDKHWVYFKEFGDFSLNILVIHWCKYTDYQEFLIATEQMNLEVKRRFEKEGIDFAFPSQTVYLENVGKEIG